MKTHHPGTSGAQYDRIADALYRSLGNDRFYQTLEVALNRSCHDAEAARAAMNTYYRVSMQVAQHWGRLTLPPDGDEYGAAIWSLPVDRATGLAMRAFKASALRDGLGDQVSTLYDEICASMARLEEPLSLGQHWYLSILGVVPEQQGGGRGRRLLDPVLTEADAAGVGTYLTTFSPRNVSFYERLGFKEIAHLTEPVTGGSYQVLLRPAPSA